MALKDAFDDSRRKLNRSMHLCQNPQLQHMDAFERIGSCCCSIRKSLAVVICSRRENEGVFLGSQDSAARKLLWWLAD